MTASPFPPAVPHRRAIAPVAWLLLALWLAHAAAQACALACGVAPAGGPPAVSVPGAALASDPADAAAMPSDPAGSPRSADGAGPAVAGCELAAWCDLGQHPVLAVAAPAPAPAAASPPAEPRAARGAPFLRAPEERPPAA